MTGGVEVTRVLTYTHPSEIPVHTGQSDLLDWLHICATPSLKNGMKKAYLSACGKEPLQVASSKLLEELFPEWFRDSLRLAQHANLTATLAALRKTSGEQPQFRAMRRNQRDVLYSIRLLAEAGIRTTDLKAQNSDEEMFHEVWRAFEDRDQSCERFRKDVESLAGPGILQSRLTAAVEAIFDGKPVDCHRLIFHGYYFITPLQYRFFKTCEYAGLNIVFLNSYDCEFPETYRTWPAFFNEATGLPRIQEWIQSDPSVKITPPKDRTAFGGILDGRPPVSTPTPAVRLLRFNQFGDFVRQFMSDHPPTEGGAVDGVGPVYLSPQKDYLSRFLREYYPVATDQQDRHFLAYPVGQLLLHLHRMWDEDQQHLQIEARALIECFASGWLTAGPLNGKTYLRELEQLLPYFDGCRTLDTWRARLDLLREAQSSILNRFQPKVLPNNPNRRFHQFLASPLANIAHFSVPDSSVTAIDVLVRRLFEAAEELFAKDEVSLQEHFAKLDSLLLEGVDEGTLLAAERRLLQGLRQRLTNGLNNSQRFLAQDLAEAISFYLGGELNSDTEEEDDDHDHGHVLSANYLVASFDRLDGYPFQHYGREIHLCLLDENSLPKRRSSIPWPLTGEMIRRFDQVPIGLVALRESQSVNADRFLLHQALSWSSSISLSWVACIDGEQVTPSPYLKLLSTCYKLYETTCPNTASPEPARACCAFGPDSPLDPDLFEQIPPDALIEHAICPRRFYYSFVAQATPAYESPFHHRFLYGNIVRALSSVTNTSESAVVDYVRPLFPQWTEITKRDQLSRTPTYVFQGYDRYDGVEYSRSRHRIHLLVTGPDTVKEVLPVLSEPKAAHDALLDMRSEMRVNLAMPAAKPSPYCKYCPHVSRCRSALLPIDEARN
uniref:PD-(D/E)XK endonuclease-like domain-containing protein n=1 Tax=Solibacter usitatus (strain Ellin6076) TaxID=234267 RepID=Q027X3_SOLUE